MLRRYLHRLYDTIISRGYIEIVRLDFDELPGRQGFIEGRLKFHDESLLVFDEVVLLHNEQVVKLRYAYHYQNGCEGTVQPRLVAKEAFKHKNGFVILENVVIGVCDTCGNRYYSADILHAVHEIATGKRPPERTAEIPVVHLTAAV